MIFSRSSRETKVAMVTQGQPGKQPVLSPGGKQGSKTERTQGLGGRLSLIHVNWEPGGLREALLSPKRLAGGAACPGSAQGRQADASTQ